MGDSNSSGNQQEAKLKLNFMKMLRNTEPLSGLNIMLLNPNKRGRKAVLELVTAACSLLEVTQVI